jgi:hypothetical protein
VSAGTKTPTLVQLRRRVVSCDRPRSAAWLVCATLRPATVTELMRVHLGLVGDVPACVATPVLAAWQEWVEADRPGVHALDQE